MSKLLDLLLPTPCILCMQIGSAMCSKCVAEFPITRNQIASQFISGFSFCTYSTESAAIVNAVKEQGQTSLIKFMAEFMSSNWPKEYDHAVLVPIPSSPSNHKKRGFSHTEMLAKEISRRLHNSSVSKLLRAVGPRSDQVGLSFPEREENLIGAFKGDLRLWHQENRAVVLIDDVFTSGATLRQAWATLGEIGVQVSGFCVFAQISPLKPLFTGQERPS